MAGVRSKESAEGWTANNYHPPTGTAKARPTPSADRSCDCLSMSRPVELSSVSPVADLINKASLDGRQVTCQFAAVHDDAAAPDNGALARG